MRNMPTDGNKINLVEIPKEQLEKERNPNYEYFSIDEPKDVVLGYKTSLDAQMLDKVEPKQENCCTPEGQIKRYVDCKGCDRKPKESSIFDFVCEDPNCPHCEEDIKQMEDDDLPSTTSDLIDGAIWELPIDDKIKVWKLIEQLVKEETSTLFTEEEVIEFTMNMISQYVVGNTNIWDRDRLKESLLVKKL